MVASTTDIEVVYSSIAASISIFGLCYMVLVRKFSKLSIFKKKKKKSLLLKM